MTNPEFELQLPKIKAERKARRKILWTNQMISDLKKRFPFEFSRSLAKDMGVSLRSLIRKAREIGIDKEEGFLEKRRDIITAMAVEAHPEHPHKGEKGWSVPNSEKHRFKPGNVSLMKTDPDVVERVRKSRNETIRKDRLRRKYGLTPLTKINLKIY